jgi:FkbM family methyltransferase
MGRLNRQIANFFGYDLMRYRKSFRFQATLDRLLANVRFDGVVDVGANVGWFSRRCMKYLDVPVYAFEPASGLFARLEKDAAAYPKWHLYQLALGDDVGQATLHIGGGDGNYNSLNDADPQHAERISKLVYIAEEQVRVTTLDRFATEHDLKKFTNLLVKIDTQGHDFRVLKGGGDTLKSARAVIVELPFQNLYRSHGTWRDILAFMESAGFEVYSLSPISIDASGRLVEADGFFVRV